MARIVFAAGTSHTPMLLASDETLPRFVETDQKMKHRDHEGRQVTYGDLLETADPKLAHMVAPEHLVARQNVARDAVKHLREVVSAASLDALIVFGDDQNESYLEDCRPTFAIYYGDTIRNGNAQHATYSHLPEWYIKNRSAFFEPEEPRDYPVHAALARHLIEALTEADFDIAARRALARRRGRGPRRRLCPSSCARCATAGRRSCRCFSTPTFHPTSRRPRRCYLLGQSVRKAVESFAGDARVGVLASGGLSHFLVDEDFDRAILKALADKDAAFLRTPAAQQAARRLVGNPQLGRDSGRRRRPRPRLVRIRAGLPHARRHRHRHELRDLGGDAATVARIERERNPGA